MPHYTVVRRYRNKRGVMVEQIIGIENAKNLTVLGKKMEYHYGHLKGHFFAFRTAKKASKLFPKQKRSR